MKYFSGAVIVSIILLCILSLLPIAGYAQLGDPGEDPDAQVPIDGGVVLLLAAGVAYGVKKANGQFKKNTAIL